MRVKLELWNVILILVSILKVQIIAFFREPVRITLGKNLVSLYENMLVQKGQWTRTNSDEFGQDSVFYVRPSDISIPNGPNSFCPRLAFGRTIKIQFVRQRFSDGRTDTDTICPKKFRTLKQGLFPDTRTQFLRNLTMFK